MANRVVAPVRGCACALLFASLGVASATPNIVLSSNLPSPQPVGTLVTFTATVAGGPVGAKYDYQFFRWLTGETVRDSAGLRAKEQICVGPERLGRHIYDSGRSAESVRYTECGLRACDRGLCSRSARSAERTLCGYFQPTTR